MTAAVLTALMAVAWRSGTNQIVRELLRVVATGEFLRQDVINAILNSMIRNTRDTVQTIAENRFMSIVRGNNPNLNPLLQMVSERTTLVEKHLSFFNRKVGESARDLLTLSAEIRDGVFSGPAIGRRRDDVIRAISLDALEKTFIKGQATGAAIPEIVQAIKSRADLLSEDGKLILPVRSRIAPGMPLSYNGAVRHYDPQAYAELIAIQATREADTIGNIERAGEIGTRFLQYNDTGKSAKAYADEGDIYCARVNGAVVTTVPGGIGPIPYIKDLLPAGFNSPHPHCRHKPRPIPERKVLNMYPELRSVA